MSKLLIFADNHYCKKSSILTRFGKKYPIRIENQIQSLTWIEDLSLKLSCDAVICLGDFFDHNYLEEIEITSLKDLAWNNLPHYFLVGNHESGQASLQYNTTNVLKSDLRKIVDSSIKIVDNNTEICFLPYIIESDRLSLKNYFGEYSSKTRRIIFSHNDISGIQLGPVESKIGFSLDEINSNCDLFINGHLHNGVKLSDHAINLGNLTGKDFGEDASRYLHNVMILDTDTLQYELIENPYAFNFYKLEITSEDDFKKLTSLKNNAVCSIQCVSSLVPSLRDFILKQSNIIENRVISIFNSTNLTDPDFNPVDLRVDYLIEYCNLCKSKIENTEILDQELSEVCK